MNNTQYVHCKGSNVPQMLPSPYPLCRNWRYDEKVPEFYVILEEKNSQKSSEIERSREETDGNDAWVMEKTHVYDDSI